MGIRTEITADRSRKLAARGGSNRARRAARLARVEQAQTEQLRTVKIDGERAGTRMDRTTARIAAWNH